MPGPDVGRRDPEREWSAPDLIVDEIDKSSAAKCSEEGNETCFESAAANAWCSRVVRALAR